MVSTCLSTPYVGVVCGHADMQRLHEAQGDGLLLT